MRTDDIVIVKQAPSTHRTWSMYLPRKQYDDMNPGELKRALCPKNMLKDWRMCEKCMSGCKAGNLLVQHMTGETVLRPEPKPLEPKPAAKPVWTKKPKLDTPKLSARERVKAADEALRNGANHNEVAEEYGYKNWDSLRDAMVRFGYTPPVITFADQDRSKYQDFVVKRREDMLRRVVEARRMVAEGRMKREEAARAVGYKRWDVVLNAYKKNKDEVDRREAL